MKDTRVHFVGVGGIGMSGLARLFVHEGATVSGSDAVETDNTKKLVEQGVGVTYDQGAENITDGIELVVYTEAMPHDHPELVAAREKGIRTINYFQALGEIANEYYLIAVAGTHGKTTTTAMLIDIFEEASFDPTAIVGSLRNKTGSNYRAGKSKYFIVEACEYKRDFLTLNPDVLVVTNLEHEHVDYYQSLSDVQDAFHELAMKVPQAGAIITNVADETIAPVLEGVQAQIIDYRQELDLTWQLRQPGMHNMLNAAAAKATAKFVGVEEKYINPALDYFAGTARRFEYKGDCNNAPVYDDYAHHPTEMKASISGARDLYPEKKLTVVFQPHTYSRTKELFDDFAEALSGADKVVLVPIYAAREKDEYGVSSEMLAEALERKGVATEFFQTLDAAGLAVKQSVNHDDVVIVMGAGDVTKISATLTNVL